MTIEELQHLCLGCMQPLPHLGEICPNCGWLNGRPNGKNHLIPGSILAGKYLVGKTLGRGGFGITYLGWSIVQNCKVAIKEFFPDQNMVHRDNNHYTVNPIADRNIKNLFDNGKKKFFEESQVLARFDANPNVVSVIDFFFENNTAYIVMEFLNGVTLMKYMERVNRPLGLQEIFNILDPIVKALEKIHEQQLLHRDISPDNIMITSTGTKLLDFGAARAFSLDGHRRNTVFVKFGYAPQEQFISTGHQGPWTDEHAFAATIYHAITGNAPPSLTERVGMGNVDSLMPPTSYGINLPPIQESALLKGMAIDYKDRYQTLTEFYNAFKGKDSNNRTNGKVNGITSNFFGNIIEKFFRIIKQ